MSKLNVQKRNQSQEQEIKINAVELRYRSIFPNSEVTIKNLRDFELFERAKNKLLRTLMQWFYNINMYHKGTRWQGIQDDGTYLTSFRELYYFTRSDMIKNIALDRLRANYRWAKRHFKNGYWKNPDFNQGIKYFTNFLSWMHELYPDNEIVKKQLSEAANNIVNPSKKSKKIIMESWYDSELKRFRSVYPASNEIENDYLNIVEHFQFLKLGWLGFTLGGDPKLKRFILDYSDEWVEEIINSDELPLFLNHINKDINRKNLERENLKVLSAASKDICNKCLSKMHIANGTHDIFFKLYDLTHDEKYLYVLEKLLEPLLNQIANPYAHPVGPILWKAFSIELFKDKKSELIQKTIDALCHIVCANPEEIEIQIKTDVNWKEPEFAWLKNRVGMKSDMPAVLYRLNKDEKWNHLPSMGAFYLVFRATKNQKYAITALTLADKILNIAGNNFPDGRFNPDSKTITAFCVGHSRNWGWGYVSTALRMLIPALTLPDINL